MKGSEETTATAGAAGAAAGAIIGWIITVVTGADTAPIVGPLAVVGAFLFGRYLPAKKGS
jgi:hypothetical protein